MFRLILTLIYLVIYVLVRFDSANYRSVFNDRENNTNFIRNIFGKRNRRIKALQTAKPFLKPYEKIFANHTLSNKNCSLSMNARNKSFTLINLHYNEHGRKMAATTLDISVDIDEVFDSVAELFSYNTTYDGLLSTLKVVATVKEEPYKIKPENKPPEQKTTPKKPKKEEKTEIVKVDFKNREILDINDGLIDINSCSEAELTALPGINIIMAKKIILYRETKRPFKNIEELFTELKIKPHFQKQLKNLICAKKINMRKVKKAQQERIIDL